MWVWFSASTWTFIWYRPTALPLRWRPDRFLSVFASRLTGPSSSTRTASMGVGAFDCLARWFWPPWPPPPWPPPPCLPPPAPPPPPPPRPRRRRRRPEPEPEPEPAGFASAWRPSLVGGAGIE